MAPLSELNLRLTLRSHRLHARCKVYCFPGDTTTAVCLHASVSRVSRRMPSIYYEMSHVLSDIIPGRPCLSQSNARKFQQFWMMKCLLFRAFFLYGLLQITPLSYIACQLDGIRTKSLTLSSPRPGVCDTSPFTSPDSRPSHP